MWYNNRSSTTAAELTWEDLITKKTWGEYGDNSISALIAMHKDPDCNNFASKLLKAPPLIVNNIRRKSHEHNDQFIQTVLTKWHAGEGDPVPFTWRHLIQCMKDASLDLRLVQIIEWNVLGKFCVEASENSYTKHRNLQ